ncbi:MAG: redoxin domain-containing protein [Bacteroidetes bacterium]|nr:redoxin domain-containing protein [Bacteroidota bacterium]
MGLFAHSQNNYRKAEEAEGIKVGETVENFTAQGLDGTFELKQALNKGPVVLVFYRGHWCPVCNQHLSELEKDLQKIKDAGAQLIAISPEKPEKLQLTQDKTKASYTLLHDKDYKIADQFDVKFRPNAMTRTTYNTVLGADLKSAHSDDSQQLPIPATYIIDTNGKIVWRQFDPDYKNRSKVEDIVNNIPKQ